MDSGREHRLWWASENIHREIRSFSDLTHAEANDLIDVLQTALGQAFQPRRKKRESAQAAGVEGRRGAERTSATIASKEDIERIDQALTRLGWDQARFAGWLRSPSSPLGKRSNPQVRTVGDANRVWWALKRLLKAAGKWNE